jgi:nicotinamide riboside transporter PnuC
LLTITIPVSVFFGVIGGTVGGLVAWRARQQLEAGGFLFRAISGLGWGAVLGFLVIWTLLVIPSLTSASGRFDWSTATFFGPIGAIVGAVSGGIVSVSSFHSRRDPATSE